MSNDSYALFWGQVKVRGSAGKCFLLLIFSVLVSSTHALPDPCHPLHLNSCVLPYPSNHWTEPSELSRTGIKIAIENQIVRQELLDFVDPAIWPENIIAQNNNGQLSGFSPATAVLFELDERPNSITLPKDGGASVMIFDVTADELISILVKLNSDALSNRVPEKVAIIQARPLSRFEFGHTYVAVVTHQLKTVDGSNFSASTGMDLAKEEGTALYSEYESTWNYLAGKNIGKDEVLWVSEFTIRNETDMITPYAKLVNAVYAEEHPMRNLSVEFKDAGRIEAYVRGEVLLTQYRTADTGWALDYRLEEPAKIWADFYLVLPASAEEFPAPLAIYGHGIGVDKTTLDTIALANVNSGIATIGIDYPNHGSRRKQDGGRSIFSLGSSPAGISAVLGIAQQAPLDLVALVKAITTELDDLDVLPIHSYQEDAQISDGIPDLDLSRIIYQGTSLGGVFGTGAIAWAPEIQAAYFQVSGAGITDILQNTILWQGIFDRMVPDIATAQERAVLINLFQHAVDPMDGINIAHWYRNPFPGLNIREKSVLLHMGIGDTVVVNSTSEALARVIELPHLSGQGVKVLKEVSGLEVINELPFDGFALIQTDFPITFDPLETIGLDELANGFFAHLSFIDRNATKMMTQWIEWMFLDAPSDPAGRADALSADQNAAARVGGTPSISSGSIPITTLLLLALLLNRRRLNVLPIH